MTTIPASKCTSRPDCPCDFCIKVRAEIAEGRTEKDEQDKLAEDFIAGFEFQTLWDSIRSWAGPGACPACPICN